MRYVVCRHDWNIAYYCASTDVCTPRAPTTRFTVRKNNNRSSRESCRFPAPRSNHPPRPERPSASGVDAGWRSDVSSIRTVRRTARKRADTHAPLEYSEIRRSKSRGSAKRAWASTRDTQNVLPDDFSARGPEKRFCVFSQKSPRLPASKPIFPEKNLISVWLRIRINDVFIIIISTTLRKLKKIKKSRFNRLGNVYARLRT